MPTAFAVALYSRLNPGGVVHKKDKSNQYLLGIGKNPCHMSMGTLPECISRPMHK